MASTFLRRSSLPAPADEVMAWHLRPGAFERLVPPWDPVRVLERRGTIEEGGVVVLGIPLGPLTLKWVARHRGYVPGREFQDVQERGPFAHWVHTHRAIPDGPDRCLLEDHIEYALPFGRIAERLAGGHVRAKLNRMFDYRHAVLRADLTRQAPFRDEPPLRVAVSADPGPLPATLLAMLSTGGHHVVSVEELSGSGPPCDALVVIKDDPDAARETLDRVDREHGAAFGASRRVLVTSLDRMLEELYRDQPHFIHLRCGELLYGQQPFQDPWPDGEPLRWVSVDDAAGAVLFALSRPELEGVFDVDATPPVSAPQFAAILDDVLGASPRAVDPPSAAAADPFTVEALTAHGFQLQLSDLEQTLRHYLGRMRGPDERD